VKIKAAVTREKGKFEFDTIEIAEPKVGEVLIKMIASGVCHTDAAVLHQFLPVTYPMVLGHEGVGIVEQTGPGVTGLKKGDPVIMSFPSCGECEKCHEGHPYACDDSFQLFFGGAYKDGTKRLSDSKGDISSLFGQGSFATYAVTDQRNAVKVDKDVDLKTLCSLGCGVQTGAGAVLLRMKPEPGSSLVVYGCGAVGMSGVMAGKIAGCSTIIAVDVVDSRLEMAKQFGATHVINGKQVKAHEEIKKITGGKGAKYGLESSGVPALVPQLLDSMAREGLAVLVSVTGPAEVPIRLEPQLMSPSVTLAGLVEGGANPKTFIPELVKFFKEGRLPVDKMCAYYKFEEIEKAFHDSHTGAVIKPILVF
jgi:aryl-alcohol dehydrogenase